ncbi:hypothetical protein AGMMS49587_17820 [Spirochaetia bacterium]|nr:hypothetical protein AGMMS49587_17820 [Spirochaetia bacterium]
MLIAMVLSCKSLPVGNAESEPPAVEAVSPGLPKEAEPSVAAEDSAFPEAPASSDPVYAAEAVPVDEKPSAAALPEEPPDTGVFGDLLEPAPSDPAEADPTEFPPAEGPLLTVLPEPAVPVLEHPPAPAPAPPAEVAAEPPAESVPEIIAQAAAESAPPVAPSADPPPPRQAAEPRAAPPTAPPVAGPAEPEVPQESDPTELPAEEETPSPLVREPIPLPVRPIPEPPAAIPPAIREDGGIVFSRVVRATVGQLVEIPFRGTGWIYLGELGARRGINYDSRRLDNEGQSFVFRAEAAGTYALKFDKQDFARDYILNDHVQVIIGEAPEISVLDRGRVTAVPRWPTAAEEAEVFRRSGNNSPSQGSPVPRGTGIADEGPSPVGPPETSAALPGSVPAVEPEQGAAEASTGAVPSPPVPSAPGESVPAQSAPPEYAAAVLPRESGIPSEGSLGRGSPPDQYLQQAQEEFKAGRVAAALSILDQFREWYPSGSDEAYWLYGQFYEANSPSRDIRLALDYYRRLVREYPQSSRYNEARRRIAYLERYYINIQ